MFVLRAFLISNAQSLVRLNSFSISRREQQNCSFIAQFQVAHDKMTTAFRLAVFCFCLL